MARRLFAIFALSVVLLSLPLLQAAIPAHAADGGIGSVLDKLNKAVEKKQWNWAATHAKTIALYYDNNRDYEKAAAYYDLTARYWELHGKPSWGIVNTIRADHVRTVVEAYVATPARLDRKLARFEPVAGVYTGLYPAGKLDRYKPSLAEEAFGMKHAMYLTYAHWRKKYKDTDSYFPLAYAEEIKKLGGAIQIGWEPSFGLDDVRDDEYVRQFAREAKASGIRVFLRFAGEMNGEWVPWFGDPQKYVEKFRLIHDIMEEEAPNVAMVWSPNFLPRDNIAPYYPGDEYVDWVGFSLYTIPFSHGEEKPGGNPIDYLRPLYEAYKHKPIMISEGAVSFYSYEQEKDYTEWAVGQLGNMYGFLPRLFPQVKAITYFNLDKSTTNYDNRNNNYDLHAREAMKDTYLRLTSHPNFLPIVANAAWPKDAVVYKPLKEAGDLRGKQSVFVYVKLPLGVQPHAVELYAGDTRLARADLMPWDMEVDFDAIPRGAALSVKALDKDGSVLLHHPLDVQK